MSPLDEKASVNFTGVTVAAILLPVALIVYHYSNADKAISTFLFLGVVAFAAKIRWRLRKHVWFWVVLLVVALFHVPLIISIHWPAHSVHGIVLLPISVVDLLITLGIIRLAEALFLKTEGSDMTSS